MPARRRLARWWVTARRPTSFLRDLPDFLIVGAQRCGTSSLYRYLGQHPSITPSIRKEVEYFSIRYSEGVDWYKSHFPVRRGRCLTFEATPDYLLHPLAARRAAELIPDARIIVMLRDPVSRAFSQYLHNLRLGHEELSFPEALDAEGTRIEGEMERCRVDPAFKAISLRRHGYVERGKYDVHLLPWLEHYPQERIHVARSEDFFVSPERVYDEVVEFLGLPPFQPSEFRNYSLRRASPVTLDVEAPNLQPDTAERLGLLFEPHSRRVEELLHRDFGWRLA